MKYLQVWEGWPLAPSVNRQSNFLNQINNFGQRDGCQLPHRIAENKIFSAHSQIFVQEHLDWVQLMQPYISHQPSATWYHENKHNNEIWSLNTELKNHADVWIIPFYKSQKMVRLIWKENIKQEHYFIMWQEKSFNSFSICWHILIWKLGGLY